MSKNTITKSKALKGSLLTGAADFSSLSVNSLKLPSDAVSSLMNGIILDNVFITNSQIDNSIIGAGGNNEGDFSLLKTSSDVTFNSVDNLNSVIWDAENAILTVDGNFGVSGCSTLGNIQICQNTVSAINSNGDLNFVPNALGTIYLTGPINNQVSSFGNFFTNLENGNVTFLASDYINLVSNKSYLSASTFSDQTFTTVDGNFTINTDTSLTPKNITSVNNTSTNVVVTTLQNSDVRVGDNVSLSGTYSLPNSDGTYKVTKIIDSNNFLISTSNILLSKATSGTLVKTPNNNINLNASQYVSVPSNIPITFGITVSSGNLNSISGNTSGMFVNAQGNLLLQNPDYNSSVGNYVIEIPQYSKFQYGTSGNNNINFDGTSLNLNSYNNISISGENAYINTADTMFYDPNPLIGNYSTNNSDTSDRGVQFRYPDASGNMKLGWFGYKQSTGEFTFLTNATNNNETITGDLGKFDIGTISVTNISLNGGGVLDMGCGTLKSVSLITGCGGTVNINGSQNVNITAANQIALVAGVDVYIPNNTPLLLGTAGSSLVESTNGNVLLTAKTNLQLQTQTNGAVIIKTNTKMSFDGTSVGNQSIMSDTNGNLLLDTTNNLILNMTSGNLIFPQNNSSNVTQNSIQFGNNTAPTEVISGNTAGINVLTKGVLNFIATSNVNISSTTGSIVLNSLGDIDLSTLGDIILFATRGNVRLLPLEKLVFNTSNTSNSISTNTAGNLMIYGPGTSGNQLNVSSGNTIELINALNINLNVISTGNINIPKNVFLNVGSSYITNDTSNNLNVVNNTSNGNLNTFISNNINLTSKNLLVTNNITNISTQNFIISGTTGSQFVVNSDDVFLSDPNPMISNYTSSLSDLSDKGIQYRYSNSSGNMRVGWFGYKESTGQFSYYSDAINTNEVITGTLGQFALGSAVISNSLSFLNTGNIDMSCGTISNLNTILGCHGTININASSNINASASNIFLDASSKVLLPYITPLAFGDTTNSISVDTNGNMTLTALGGSGQLILNGNVQINGTTENIYSTVTNIQDPHLSIGGVLNPTVNDSYDRGIEFKWFNNNAQLGSTGSVIGFFGFQNSSGRFDFIPNATKVNNSYFGSFGNVQFGNGYFNNLDVACGTISNVNTLTGCGGTVLNLVASSNVNVSTASLTVPFNSMVAFGSSTNSLSANSSGTLTIVSLLNTNITSISAGINLITPTNGSGFVTIPQNTPFNLGSGTSGSTFIQDTSANLKIQNTSGNIYVTPNPNLVNGTFGSIIIPTNTSIIFSGTNSNNRISSDGNQLNLYGYSSIGINSSTVTIAGNVNIIGAISATTVSSDVNQFILPLGTSQIGVITSITNTTTTGNVLVTTVNNNYLTTGDSVTLKNTDSIPSVDGTYVIVSSSSPNSFIVTASKLTSPGTTGSIKSVLTTYQAKDVGIAVDYWSTVGNTSITAGSANYKTGFFGWQNTSQRWVFYNNATISNDVVTGTSFGNVQINELFTNKISGFSLDGTLQGGSFIISGTNFQVQGGSIDSTPIGANTAQTGRFTTLSSTVSTDLTAVKLESTLQYSVERFTLNSSLQTRNPSASTVTSFVTVTGTTFGGSGTMGSSGITDGQVKKVVMSAIGPGCSYTLFFGTGKLITPNPLGGSPKQMTFKRQGQNCEIIFDGTLGAWILLNGSAYVQN